MQQPFSAVIDFSTFGNTKGAKEIGLGGFLGYRCAGTFYSSAHVPIHKLAKGIKVLD